ncbi:major facilitator superfamily domain-containing protein [Aspergillus pseudotamarii]|uniref:Major facilitator superfamily domain-containing protein n=1 Tax=Aspergillus pseudotamarii TaxID=132259 RepID=A0A5N6STW3_ASPPS|nr:major facilitator superfamily domain-containing protein [Aspergillus pseudotamarii]KAE8137269.1 major facilitator superfamily domain-containing protein [Aspergillus pseudotamarii]
MVQLTAQSFDRSTTSHPPDGGRSAWIFLASVSVMLQLTWGFTISFGAFREYYFYGSAFSGNQVIAVIGVVSTGVIQLLCPFLVHILGGRAQLRKPLLCIGSAIVVAASIGAGFSHTPVQLIMTQGVLYGLGSGLVFAPNMSLIDEWFIRRRSLAYGIYFACSSIAAAIIPPVMRVLLAKYSAKATLIGWGIFVAVVLSIALIGVRPRLPSSSRSAENEKENPLSGQFSYGFLRKPLFWLVLLSNVLQALSQYLPSVYIPSYATAVIGASSASASALLAIYNIASAICQPFLGLLADKRGILYPLLLSTLVPAIAVLCIWGFATKYGLLALVCILFGGLSGGYVVLRNRFATTIVGNSDRPNEELIVSGLIMFFRGGATIASGFVATAVSSAGEDRGLHKGSYGAGQWLPLILTVGILTGVSCIGALGFLREDKQGRSVENSREQAHGNL